MTALRAHHVVTPAILLRCRAAFGAELCVRGDPICSLAFVLLLLKPQPELAARRRGVGFNATCEAELRVAVCARDSDADVLRAGLVEVGVVYGPLAVRAPPHLWVCVDELAETVVIILAKHFAVVREEVAEHVSVTAAAAPVHGARRHQRVGRFREQLALEVVAEARLVEVVVAAGQRDDARIRHGIPADAALEVLVCVHLKHLDGLDGDAELPLHRLWVLEPLVPQSLRAPLELLQNDRSACRRRAHEGGGVRNLFQLALACLLLGERDGSRGDGAWHEHAQVLAVVREIIILVDETGRA
eukprot:PhM_4_TR11855/c0_g1_i1/m.65897